VLALLVIFPSLPSAVIRYELLNYQGGKFYLFDNGDNVRSIVAGGNIDYDAGETSFNLIIRACDQGIPSNCAEADFNISIVDVNDNSPVIYNTLALSASAELLLDDSVGVLAGVNGRIVMSLSATDRDSQTGFGRILFEKVTEQFDDQFMYARYRDSDH